MTSRAHWSSKDAWIHWEISSVKLYNVKLAKKINACNRLTSLNTKSRKIIVRTGKKAELELLQTVNFLNSFISTNILAIKTVKNVVIFFCSDEKTGLALNYLKIAFGDSEKSFWCCYKLRSLKFTSMYTVTPLLYVIRVLLRSRQDGNSWKREATLPEKDRRVFLLVKSIFSHAWDQTYTFLIFLYCTTIQTGRMEIWKQWTWNFCNIYARNYENNQENNKKCFGWEVTKPAFSPHYAIMCISIFPSVN